MYSAKTFPLAVAIFATLLLETSSAASDITANEISGLLENALQDAAIALSNDKSLLAEVKKGLEIPLSNLADAYKSIASDAVKGDGPKVNVPDYVREFIYKKVASSDAALARAKKIIADGLRRASDPQAKVSLTVVSIWLKAFEVLVNKLHGDIKNAVDSGSEKDIKKSIAEIDVAVPVTEVTVAGFYKILPDGPVKTNFKKEMDTIIANAIAVGEALKSLLK